MFKKILVPLDISDFDLSIGIIPYVSNIAKGLGVPVLVASVLDPDNLDIPPAATEERHGVPIANLPQTYAAHVTPDKPVFEEGSSRPPEGREDLSTTNVIENYQLEVKRHLNRVVSRLADDGVQADSTVSVNTDVVGEIVRLAEREGCELIAMATHSRNLLSQAIQGSVTNGVLRSASVPVMAIAPQNDGEFVPEQRVNLSTVLVPLDGSEFAEAVLPYVEHLAQKMSLELLLVRVLGASNVYPTTPGIGAPAPAGMGRAAAEAYGVAEEEAVSYLKAVTDRLAARGLNVRWELLRGAPSSSIAEVAGGMEDTIIALVSHGRSGVLRWVVGSVAEELLRGTGNPVLVIPSQLAEESG